MGVRRLDRRRRLLVVPYQWDWALRSAGLTRHECIQAVWAVSPNGQKHSGAAAFNVVLDTLLGDGRVCYRMYRLPLIRRVEDGMYAFIARNRSRLPGATPAIDQPTPWRPRR